MGSQQQPPQQQQPQQSQGPTAASLFGPGGYGFITQTPTTPYVPPIESRLPQPQRSDTIRAAGLSGTLQDVQTLLHAWPADTQPPQQYLNAGFEGACRAGNADIARYLLSIGAQMNHDNVNPRSIPIMEVALEKGWDINGGGLFNSHILYQAMDDEDTVRWILDHGGRVDAPSAYGANLLDAAAGKGSFATFRLLHEDRGVPLHATTLHNGITYNPGHDTPAQFEIMHHLVYDLGVDINAVADNTSAARRNKPWGTPLHHAVEARSLPKLKWLLEHGADPRVRNLQSQDALEFARSRQWAEGVRAMQTHVGEDVDMQ